MLASRNSHQHKLSRLVAPFLEEVENCRNNFQELVIQMLTEKKHKSRKTVTNLELIVWSLQDATDFICLWCV